MKVVSQYTTIYTPTPRNKVEKLTGQDSNASSGSYRGTTLTFSQLKEKMRLLEADTRPKADLKPKIDPALATALTAANTQDISPFSGYQTRNIDIVHDNSGRRGKSTNIEA